MRHSDAEWRWFPLCLVLGALAVMNASGVSGAEAAAPGATKAAPRPSSRELERDVAQFLERYRRFLGCCAASLDAIPAVKALEGEASALLARAQGGVGSELKKLRGFTIQELLTPVERARNDLHAILKKLEQIEEAEEKLEAQELDFFTLHTERRKLQDQLEAIPREFQAPKRAGGPPAGMEIGTTPPTGPEIGTVPPTGPEVGTPGKAGSEIGTTPPSGKEIGTTPPTGKEIGTTPPTGPEIGESPPKR